MVDYYSIDFETALIQPGLIAPPPVVLTWADGAASGLIPSSDGWRHQEEWLAHKLGTEFFVGFNIAFDFGVILAWFPSLTDAVFRAYDEGRVHEIELAERLGEIATGRPDKHSSLARLAAHYHVAALDKENSPRLDYARFLFEPELPEGHRRYAIEDAETGHELYRRVRGRYGSDVSDEAVAKCSRTALWLHLCSAWGLRVHPARLEALRQATIERQRALLEIAKEVGFVRPDGSKNVARIQQYVCHVYGVPWRFVEKRSNSRTTWLTWEVCGEIPPAIVTDAGNVSTNKVVLLDSNDPTLEAFSEWGQVASVLAKDMPMLSAGTRAPIHTKFHMANTTRTTSRRGDVAGGNLQNFTRESDTRLCAACDWWGSKSALLEGACPSCASKSVTVLGTRECAEPRAGYCYGEVDVTGLESGTLAQALIWTIGARAMAERLNSGVNDHILTASVMLGITYDECAKIYASAEEKLGAGVPLTPREQEVVNARQVVKPANFGYPGGMSASTFIHFARAQYGFRLTDDDATALKSAWAEANPDIARTYLNGYIRSLKNANGLYDFYIPGSPGYVPGRAGILRRDVPYCSAANGHFQGLGAQVMTAIGWDLTIEAWTDRSSPLYVDHGARMASFVHDSFFYEIPIGLQHPVLMRVKEVMLAGLAKGLPDLRMGAEPVAMARWSKKAKPRYDAKGELAIWEP